MHLIIKFLTVVSMLLVVSINCNAKSKPIMHVPDKLVNALIQIESGGDLFAKGDKTLQYQAYGPLQIRHTVIMDVNQTFHTHYTEEQCMGNMTLSVKILSMYQTRYATISQLGHPARIEDMARIWNGGPSMQNTDKYWTLIQDALAHPAKKYYVSHHTKAKTPSFATSE